MLERIRKYCRENSILSYGDKIVIACSGGADSLTLVDVLLKLQEEYALTLVVAHLDHMFRGDASAADAKFVQEFCLAKGIPCHMQQTDVNIFAALHGLGSEEAARIVRYQFLRKVASDLGGAKIATGHHKDDQAETILLHLLRGAGSAGISGIRPINHDIIRPLLSVTRKEIDLYCEQNHFLPRIDQTNFEDCYTRNRIRLSLLPKLKEEFNPSITDALCKTAQLVGDEHDYVVESAKLHIKKLLQKSQKNSVIEKKDFLSLHIALKREVIRQIIIMKQGDLKGVTFQHIEKMIEIAEFGQVGAVFILPSEIMMKVSYNTLVFSLDKGDHTSQEMNQFSEIVLDETMRNDFFNITITARLLEEYPQETGEYSAVFDAEKIYLPLFVRARENGDRFKPLGMKGSKKLKEYFIDQKIERSDRGKIPLVCDQQGILWVVGHRLSEVGKVTASTKKFLQVIISGRK